MRGGRYPGHGGRLVFVALAVLGVALTAVVVGVPGDTAASVPRAAAHDQAAALLNKVVLPAGAVRLSRAPTALLDWPDRAGSTTVERLNRFWTVSAGTALEVQHALGALQPNDLQLEGRSSSGGAGPEQATYGLRYAAAPEAVVVLYAPWSSPISLVCARIPKSTTTHSGAGGNGCPTVTPLPSSRSSIAAHPGH